MSNVKDFLKRKDIVITPQRYLIEALGAMAQGLFASLLIGTIIKTLGQQTGLDVLVDLGSYATAMSGPAMAVAIGWALHCPPLVLFSLVTVGYSSNALGGAGGPLAVLIIAIVAAELGKAVSKETKIDILVTPLVTIFAGVGLSMLIAAPIGAAASQVGTLIMWATEQAPLVMGLLVSVIVGEKFIDRRFRNLIFRKIFNKKLSIGKHAQHTAGIGDSGVFFSFCIIAAANVIFNQAAVHTQIISQVVA